MIDNITEFELKYQKIAIKEMKKISITKGPQLHPEAAELEFLPAKVDLSEHLRFIRKQGGLGCWGYSFLAMWDIMNDIVCPFSPNLSFRLWKTLFYKQNIWKETGDIYSPDGRYHDVAGGALEFSCIKSNPPFFGSFGCTTEGTDPTLHNYPARYHGVGWSVEGINEASNYRLESVEIEVKEKGKVKKILSNKVEIAINSEEFIRWLSDSYPIQIGGGPHYVAVVGFDKISETFKIVDTGGDKSGDGGYNTFTFQQLDNKEHVDFLGGPIDQAYIILKWNKVPPPRPVPAARIHVKHNDDRGNIHLWLSVEDSPLPKLKIWPHGWDDNSRNLHFTVRLPSEFIWPPSDNNRIILELYDAATYSNTGGEIVEFTVAFGGHVIECKKLVKNPITFNARDRLYLTIP